MEYFSAFEGAVDQTDNPAICAGQAGAQLVLTTHYISERTIMNTVKPEAAITMQGLAFS